MSERCLCTLCMRHFWNFCDKEIGSLCIYLEPKKLSHKFFFFFSLKLYLIIVNGYMGFLTTKEKNNIEKLAEFWRCIAIETWNEPCFITMLVHYQQQSEIFPLLVFRDLYQFLSKLCSFMLFYIWQKHYICYVSTFIIKPVTEQWG